MQKHFSISTERLLLRPFTPTDLASLHEYASDSENSKYMIHLPNTTLEQTQQFLQCAIHEWEKDLPDFYELAIVLAEKHIGAVSVYLDEQRRIGELGWVLNKAYHGNGYATEAAFAIRNFSFDILKLKKLVAHCDYRNEASCRIMQKIGMSQENDGVRKYKDTDDEIREFMYSLRI